MPKTNFTVVRNEGFMRGSFETRYRHNERQNETYGNGDIDQSREHLNIHFRQNLNPDGSQETYGETFDRLLAEKKISEKWLKPDSKLVDELVFDVNTDYFEQRGGYDYAMQFFTEAYRLAVKEVGSEDYILSAVLHADERNKALSEQIGYDVYHYHLHVVYVPVVEKREYFRKKKGEPENAERKLKEVYQQISHAKKWPIRVPVERDGKTIILNSYSLLQDRYFEHMREAGFTDFERGERGSTAEHLDVIDYKIQQDKKRLDALDEQAQLAKTEQTLEKKTAQVEKLDEKISVKNTAKATIKEVDAMGKPALLGGVNFTVDEAAKLKSLAKKSVTADDRISANKKKIAKLDEQISSLNSQLRDAKAEVKHWHTKYTDLWNEVKDFIGAIRKFPARLKAFIAELFRPEREAEQRRELERQQHQQTKKKSYDIGR
ncbi:Plasmid recombination enzyme type 2 [Clostridia bacterium]|nr:Plasmid recombination enzyme type 2 [Clostridia bacterium]